MLGSLTLPTLISRLIVLVISFTIHEFSHAWTADQFGDDTPRSYGRLTLNPIKHLDPLGSLMLLFAGFGWAKPVPINPYALLRNSPASVMWVSLAGPASNLLMALLASIPFRAGLVSFSQGLFQSTSVLPTLDNFMLDFILINLVLMLFNLLPVAPLDGEKILDYFVPDSWSGFFRTIRPYGPMILLFMFAFGPLLGIDIIGSIIWPPLNFLLRLLIG